MAGDSSKKALPSGYEGREPSYIKHRLLSSYLEKLFLIVGMSAQKLGISEICYVDCFAGPWGDETDDLNTTSIAISLSILDKCRKELVDRGVRLAWRALYVESNPTAHARLKSFLDTRTPAGIQAKSLHGDFVNLRHEILQWCGERSFTFFFIDPTGWKEVSVPTLRPLLQRRQSEFLVNFMYDFVNRTMSMEEWTEEMTMLLGASIDLGGQDSSGREKLVLNTYRQSLKRCVGDGTHWPRSAYVRVLDREKERPKYHLVYLTSHPLGIIEFMEISEGLDIIQKQVRAETKLAKRAEKSGMADLFEDRTDVDALDGHVPIESVESYWLKYLAPGQRRVGTETFADLLEHTDWFPGDFQRALRRLIDNGKVQNLDEQRRRPKKPLHWEDNERLVLVGGRDEH